MVVRPSYVFSSPVDVVVVTVTLPEEACEMEVTVSPRWKTAPSDLALDSRAEVTLWYPPSGAASVPAKLSRGQRERERVVRQSGLVGWQTWVLRGRLTLVAKPL